MGEMMTIDNLCLNHVMGHHKIKDLKCYGCKADESNKYCNGYIPVPLYRIYQIMDDEIRNNIRDVFNEN